MATAYGRLPALDGLRGVAALVVVVFHILLLSPTFASPDPDLRWQEPAWWVTHTPISILWAGPQAVFLFFVLSGYVLALPATTRAVEWRRYYPQRLIRLYVPVWASLLLAWAVAAIVPREPRAGLSEWYASHTAPVGLSEALRDSALVFGTGWLNSPLWSLRWEVLFSLLLPLYLLLARRGRRVWAAKAVLLLVAVMGANAVDLPEARYLSMFAFGVLLAFERERLSTAARRLGRPYVGKALAAACLLLLTAEVTLLTSELDLGALRAAAAGMQALGACLAVALALHWEPARRRLGAGWARWLGLRSFSLYLVHEPLAVSSGALWPQLPVVGHVALVIPASLLVAHVFQRAVEGPAQRLARAAGARLT